MKIVLGILIVFAGIWIPFLMTTWLPWDWERKWYAIPLVISLFGLGLSIAITGIFKIVKGL